MRNAAAAILIILIGSKCVASTLLMPGITAFCRLYNKADIMLLVSDSRNTMRYRWMSPIIAPGLTTFISRFLLSLDYRKVRVGIMAFSDTARLVSPISHSPTTISQRMMWWRPQFRGVKTYIGINYARSYFKSNSSPSCRKIIVLIVDNNSENYKMTRQQVQLSKNEGITLLTVGYSKPFNQLSELRDMGDDDDDVFWAADDLNLFLLLPKILKVLCSVINRWHTLPSTIPTTQAPLQVRSDLVLILDDSESTRRFDGISIFYEPSLVNFVKQVALHMDQRQCRLGVVMVSTTGRVIVNLGTSLSGINTAVDTFTPEFNITRTSRGYDVAKEILEASQNEQIAAHPNRRIIQHQYVLLIADGINFDDDMTTTPPFQLTPAVTFGLFLVGTSAHGPAATTTNIAKSLQNSTWYSLLEDASGLPGKAEDVANFVCMN